MKISDVIREGKIKEKKRQIDKIPESSRSLLKAMGIPEDEWDFMVGRAAEMPPRFNKLKENLIRAGLRIEEKSDEKIPYLHIYFPEGKAIKNTLFLSCLSQCAIQPHKKIVIEFSENSSGTVVIGSPIPKLFSTNFAQSDIEIKLGNSAKGEIALLFSYDVDTISRSNVNTILENGSSLTISGVIFDPGIDLGIHWNFELHDNSTLLFDEVGFVMNSQNYRGSWSDIVVKGKKVRSQINSADFAFAEGESRAVYVARILHGGKGAEVEINSYSMDFSKGAKKMFLPGFYTVEDEVVLQHSAGSAQFSRERIEYMLGRGLSRSDISKLIIETVLEKTVYNKLPAEFVEEMSNYTRFILSQREVIL